MAFIFKHFIILMNTSNVTNFDEIDEDFNFVIRKKKKTQINLGKNEIIKDF